MNVNPYNTTDYENIANWTIGQLVKTNPIQTQSVRPALFAKELPD
jgi:hypothetical protein